MRSLRVDPALGARGCIGATCFDDAQDVIRKTARSLGTERVALSRAGRRVLADPVIARIDSPRWDVAAMDGFAVRADDLRAGRPIGIMGASFAGDGPAMLAAGWAMAISTGGPMPIGADVVVPIEQVTVRDRQLVGWDVPAKQHVRRRATDFAKGVVLLEAGLRIGPRALVVAAAANVADVVLHRRPRVHVIANGNELSAPGTIGPDSNAIPDSLSDALHLMVRQWGGKPGKTAILRDEIDAICAVAADMIDSSDILVVVGGASHGERDLVRAALMPLGLRTAFAGVAMKPGKPFWFGRIGGTLIFGLPGNPTAAMTIARLFLAPAVCAMAGAAFDDALCWFDRPLAGHADADRARDRFLCAKADGSRMRLIENQEASRQLQLVSADHLVHLPSAELDHADGQSVRCLSF